MEKTAPLAQLLYFASLGVNTNARNEKNGFMIRTRGLTAGYILKELPQLIVIVNCVWRKEKKMDFKIIAVDFDGTLCKNEWPEIGAPNKALISYLKEMKAAGAKLILWTCRVGDVLENAVRWSSEQGLVFDAVNENLPEVIEFMGGDTRKIFADIYVDDRNCKYPLKPEIIQIPESDEKSYKLTSHEINLIEQFISETGQKQTMSAFDIRAIVKAIYSIYRSISM